MVYKPKLNSVYQEFLFGKFGKMFRFLIVFGAFAVLSAFVDSTKDLNYVYLRPEIQKISLPESGKGENEI